MKKYTLFSLFVLLLTLNACMDKYTEVYTANVPVYMSYENLRSAVKTTAATELVNPGKIYFKDNYILIVEKHKGVHILDVSAPANPKNVFFIEIPGCVDIAVKNSVLYADSYIDLVAIDVSDLAKIKEVNRVKDAFPYAVPPTENEYRIGKIDQEKGVVIDWELKKERNELEEQPYYPVYYGWELDKRGMYNLADAAFSGSSPTTGAATFGKGGSMARFGLYDDFLYTVDQYSMYVFDVSTDNNPVKIVKQGLSWNIETMFLYDDHMFLGTTNGLIILDLETPSLPKQISSFAHITSCDPVVVQDGYAYITLRSGQVCRNTTVNRLDIVKLSADYKTNSMLASYDLKQPYGLGIDNNTLFVCDDGLKVFEATDKLKIMQHQIAHFSNIKAFDVIPLNKFLFTVGEDGFYLYDYTNLNDIKQISKIPVAKK